MEKIRVLSLLLLCVALLPVCKGQEDGDGGGEEVEGGGDDPPEDPPEGPPEDPEEVPPEEAGEEPGEVHKPEAPVEKKKPELPRYPTCRATQHCDDVKNRCSCPAGTPDCGKVEKSKKMVCQKLRECDMTEPCEERKCSCPKGRPDCGIDTHDKSFFSKRKVCQILPKCTTTEPCDAYKCACKPWKECLKDTNVGFFGKMSAKMICQKPKP